MNPILLLLYSLVASDPELTLPLPEDYNKLFCQFHTHPICGNMPEEKPEADARDTFLMTVSIDQLRESLDYDPETGVLSWRVAQGSVKAGCVAGYVNARGYRVVMKQGYFAHRVAWALSHGEWPSYQIDHINHLKDDNRLSNLREVNNSENHRNSTLVSSNTSGMAGIYWRKDRKKWYVQIQFDLKRHHVGAFEDLLSAVAARKNAEVLHGYHTNHGKVLT